MSTSLISTPFSSKVDQIYDLQFESLGKSGQIGAGDVLFTTLYHTYVCAMDTGTFTELFLRKVPPFALVADLASEEYHEFPVQTGHAYKLPQ